MNLEGICSEQYAAVHQYVSNRIRNKDDADELTQDIFCGFLRNYSTFRGDNGCKPLTYLNQIMRNKIADYYRKKYRRGEVLVQDASSDDWTYIETDIEIREIIGKLPAPYKGVMSGICQGRSLAEIARRNNEKFEAVRARYRRGLSWLQNHMEELQ